MTVHWQPDGYPNVIPCLTVKDASGLFEFICRVFDGKEVERHDADGVLRHGEIRIGDSMVMVSEASERWPAAAASVHLYVPDADAVYKRALSEGAMSVMEVDKRFYGDRSGGVKDPWGITWWVATHVEDVSPEEIQRRAKAAE